MMMFLSLMLLPSVVIADGPFKCDTPAERDADMDAMMLMMSGSLPPAVYSGTICFFFSPYWLRCAHHSTNNTRLLFRMLLLLYTGPEGTPFLYSKAAADFLFKATGVVFVNDGRFVRIVCWQCKRFFLLFARVFPACCCVLISFSAWTKRKKKWEADTHLIISLMFFFCFCLDFS